MECEHIPGQLHQVRQAGPTYVIQPNPNPEILESLMQRIAQMETTVSQQLNSLEETVRHQRYAIQSLERQVADLQTHAIHGTLQSLGQEQTPYQYF